MNKALGIQPEKFIRRTYTVEAREFRDAFWHGGWYKNLKPSWSEWVPLYSYTSLKNIKAMHITLLKGAPYRKCRTEYRVIKEAEEAPF